MNRKVCMHNRLIESTCDECKENPMDSPIEQEPEEIAKEILEKWYKEHGGNSLKLKDFIASAIRREMEKKGEMFLSGEFAELRKRAFEYHSEWESACLRERGRIEDVKELAEKLAICLEALKKFRK